MTKATEVRRAGFRQATARSVGVEAHIDTSVASDFSRVKAVDLGEAAFPSCFPEFPPRVSAVSWESDFQALLSWGEAALGCPSGGCGGPGGPTSVALAVAKLEDPEMKRLHQELASFLRDSMHSRSISEGSGPDPHGGNGSPFCEGYQLGSPHLAHLTSSQCLPLIHKLLPPPKKSNNNNNFPPQIAKTGELI